MATFTYLRQAIIGPTDAERKTAINSRLQKEYRGLQREIERVEAAERTAKTYIRENARDAQKAKDAFRRQQARKNIRTFSIEYARAQKQVARLKEMQATVASVKMRINEQFAMKRLQKGMVKSAEVMQQVNELISLPRLNETMRSVAYELGKAGIVEEMTHDYLDSIEITPEIEDEAVEEEIAAALKDAFKGEVPPDIMKAGTEEQEELPEPVRSEPVKLPATAQDQEEDPETELARMRERLVALKS